MQKIFYSELLKLRHLGSNRFLIIIPFLTVLIAFLMGGLQIFVPFSVYWWEAIFLYLVNGLLFIVDRRLEDQAGYFQNVTNKHFTWKITLMKMVLIGMRTLISSLFLLAFLYLVAFIYTDIIPINITKTSTSLILIWMTTLWNIPFLYLMSKYMSHFILLALNTLVCLLIAPFIAQSPLWFVLPYTYHYKIAQFLLNLKPSGDIITNQNQTSILQMSLIIILSMIMTLLLSYALKRRESNATEWVT